MVIEIAWEFLTPAQAAPIVAFLEAHGGDKVFLYTGTKFTAEVWEERVMKGGFRSITATFEQSFALVS